MSSLFLNFIWSGNIVPSLLSKLEMAKTAQNQQLGLRKKPEGENEELILDFEDISTRVAACSTIKEK